MFGKRKTNGEQNRIENELYDMTKLLNLNAETLTPVQMLAITTLVYGKMNAEKEGTSIGIDNVSATNYFGLNDFSIADTILLITFYNMLFVCGEIPVDKSNVFRTIYLGNIVDGIGAITDLDYLEDFYIEDMAENRIDTYLDAAQDASDNNASIIDRIKREFEIIISNDIMGKYQEASLHSPIMALGINETINIKTQVGALFEGLTVAFDGVQNMVIKHYK